ncbi:hypothetical protein, partial [Mesorhizobium sp. SP-1A]|uniref:hypothetical protein n=1 Tax=Mesorhizobium sp. SP-1A TaxID=3077840 RepID=UPI0028F722D7
TAVVDDAYIVATSQNCQSHSLPFLNFLRRHQKLTKNPTTNPTQNQPAAGQAPTARAGEGLSSLGRNSWNAQLGLRRQRPAIVQRHPLTGIETECIAEAAMFTLAAWRFDGRACVRAPSTFAGRRL